MDSSNQQVPDLIKLDSSPEYDSDDELGNIFSPYVIGLASNQTCEPNREMSLEPNRELSVESPVHVAAQNVAASEERKFEQITLWIYSVKL